MRLTFGLFLTAVIALGAGNAWSTLSPDQIVGQWTPERSCGGNGFAYVMNGSEIHHELNHGGAVYRTPVQVNVDGNVVRVRFEEKIYSFRLPTPDTLQAFGYTDTRNGLTAEITPRVWHRCL